MGLDGMRNNAFALGHTWQLVQSAREVVVMFGSAEGAATHPLQDIAGVLFQSLAAATFSGASGRTPALWQTRQNL